MNFRILSTATLALTMLVSAVALADEVDKAKTHDGKVVSITAEELVMTSTEGKEHSHALAPNAKLTLDGKTCKASDLKADMRIRVTLKNADSQEAIKVEALDKNPEFASL